MRHQLSRDAYRQLQADIMDGVMKGTPRYMRVRQSANTLLALLRDFLPQDDDCLRRVEEHLIESFFYNNGAIINVPPEKDAMDKLALERAMLEPMPLVLK